MTTPGRRQAISEIRATARVMRRRKMIPKMLIAAIVSNQVLAWTLMIMVGVAHGSWWKFIPTMSWHAATLITGFLFLGVALTMITIQAARELT